MRKTMLLIHGWNYLNYTSQTTEKDAWHNRKIMVDELEKNFQVYKLNLPGFCGAEEPSKSWTLDDYATYIYEYIKKNNLKIDYILGYSFGGAVAIRYKTKYQDSAKLILVSPAIIRNQNSSKKFFKTPKAISGLRNFIRDLYLIHIVKTEEMVYGTKFLRASYQSIVREDLTDEIKKIPAPDFIIIYGDQDNQVNPHQVINYLGNEYTNNIIIIKDGGHDIGTTHVKEVGKAILLFSLK